MMEKCFQIHPDLIILASVNPNDMAIHRARMQRQVRDKKQESKFLLTLGIITVLLILVLYLIYG